MPMLFRLDRSNELLDEENSAISAYDIGNLIKGRMMVSYANFWST
jgi:hypothetical protein